MTDFAIVTTLAAGIREQKFQGLHLCGRWLLRVGCECPEPRPYLIGGRHRRGENLGTGPPGQGLLAD